MAVSGKGAEGLDTAARAMAREDADVRTPDPPPAEPVDADEQPVSPPQDP